MFITKKSPISGNFNTLDLPVTEAQFAAWRAGAYIQDAFPHLSADHREFILSGITPQEWDDIFGEEEELTNAPDRESM